MHPATAQRRARLSLALAPQSAVPTTSDAISDLRLYPVREPASGRAYTILRITTRSGLKGYGECARATKEDFDAARQYWTGRPATAYMDPRPDPPLAGAIDMALLDILGQTTKAPIYRVLGGPTRNKARALTSATLETMEAKSAAGYRAFLVSAPPPKARNQGQAYQLAVRKIADAIRAHEGDFVLEGHELLTPGDAASVATTIEHLHPLWFDEPCALTNQQSIRKIADEAVVPLGFGRGIRDASTFQDLLRAQLIDIVRPDLHTFGITRSRKIAALAEPYYVAVAPRHEGGPIATAAALHLAASLPNFFIQNIPYPDAEEDRRMRAAIAGPEIERVKDGFASLPTGPGLGITVNESALEKYHAS